MKILAVSTSARSGEKKINQPEILLVEEQGVAQDAHAGPGVRQVSLLGIEDIESMVAAGYTVRPGDFAENITTQGVDLPACPLGTRFRVGDGAILELSQIGKRCHGPCAIMREAGTCVMPKRGVFCRVIKGGIIRPGDAMEQLPASDA